MSAAVRPLRSGRCVPLAETREAQGAPVGSRRWAVYFAPPPGHPLWQAGCDWLGRDPRVHPAPEPPARAHTTAPWRYGFHATLRPPCRLRDGAEAEWLAAVQSLARRHRAFAMPALHVAMLDDFLALRPLRPLSARHPLRRLADACVLQLDRWRAAPDEAERARRLRAQLSARHHAHVQRHGYPYVLDDWRFHMTLTDGLAALDAASLRSLRRQAERHFDGALRAPLVCDALCVFVEPAPGEPLRLTHRFALRAARASRDAANS